MKTHPLCAKFANVSEAKRMEMAASVAAIGQLELIWTYKNQIIDGKNREAACHEAGITPKYKEWKPKAKHPDEIHDELIDFVIAKNSMRRHDNEGALALLGAELLALKKAKTGQNPAENDGVSQDTPRTRAQVAGKLGISVPTLARGVAIAKRGTPELQEAVCAGSIGALEGSQIAKQPEAAQREAVAKRTSGEKPPITPFGELLVRLEWVFKTGIPTILETALDSQRALGARAGGFSANLINTQMTKVHREFQQVQGMIRNAQEESRRGK